MHPHKKEAEACSSAKMRRMGLADGGAIPAGQPGSDNQPDGISPKPKVTLTLGNPESNASAPMPIPERNEGGGGGAESGHKHGGRVK